MKKRSIKFLSVLLAFALLLSVLGLTVSAKAQDGETTDNGILYGDVNADGKISVADVLTVQKHLASVITLTERQAAAADVDGD